MAKRKRREHIEPPQLLAGISPATAIHALIRQNALDPLLVPVDRHMQRWATSQGSGLPNTQRALHQRLKMPPLEGTEAIETDRIVLETPSPWRRVIQLWYRSDCSIDQLCERLNLGRSALYTERKVALAYLCGRLVSQGVRLDYAPWPLTVSVQTA